MEVKSISKRFSDFEVDSFVTTKKLIKILERRNQFKDDLISIFDVPEDETGVIQVGNSRSLLDAIFQLENICRKIDINVQIKDIYLKKMLEAEKAEFEIYHITDNYLIKNNKSNVLIAETTYSAKNDILEYYNFSKFANYCRDKEFSDLIDIIKNYLKKENEDNVDERSLRLVHVFNEGKYYIRAITSSDVYQDFGINFSIFVALMALDKYVKDSKKEIYINNYRIDESHVYVSFALKKEFRISDNVSLSFNLVLENDEIKRGAVSFNGIFKLTWKEDDKESEVYLKPRGVKKDDRINPVDLLSYSHRGKVQNVFEKVQKLPDLIEFFVNQVSDDAKRISDISHPDDIRKFIRDKVKNSKKAEFTVYKQQVLNKLMSISVTNTFTLFKLLREVEDLFEHDDIISLNFWRSKLYEALIDRK